MTPEEALAKAADLLEQDGWCQGVLIDHYGRRCLLGAIEAARLEDTSDALFSPICNAIQAELGGANPISWNDTPGRTQEEVVTLLRNAKRWL